MRMTILALAALCCAASALPALGRSAGEDPRDPASPSRQNGHGCGGEPTQPCLAQAVAPPPPDPTQEENDQGGSGTLPGAQFQRRLEGGPGFVCTATNALRSQQCTASCRKGETADCVDAEGSGAPSCACTKG